MSALTVLSAFTTSASLRRSVWREKPTCVECGTRVASPDLAGYLEVPDAGIALACKERCYAAAVARINPTFDRVVALERELARILDGRDAALQREQLRSAR